MTGVNITRALYNYEVNKERSWEGISHSVGGALQNKFYEQG